MLSSTFVDENGHPSFQALQHRRAHPRHVVTFYAFDLLHLDGTDLTRSPLDERRDALGKVVADSGVLLSEPLRGTPDRVIEAVRHVGLEGVIAKRRHSRYESGQRSGAWQKLKLDKQQEFVVGGYRPGPYGVDALLVGFYERRKLFFAGKVRAGFTPHLRRDVFASLSSLNTSKCPLSISRTAARHTGAAV
jgi:ATP-dependent DNA ligase